MIGGIRENEDKARLPLRHTSPGPRGDPSATAATALAVRTPLVPEITSGLL